jgi:SAM-dependent methyltransferase
MFRQNWLAKKKCILMIDTGSEGESNLTMLKIDKLASNLVQTSEGLWVSKSHSAVSYPSEGMDFTYQIEDHSYWFIHRNRCITTLINHFPPQGVFFDIGGGNGFVSQAVQKMGIETVLVEPDPAGSRHALERGLKPVVSAALGDAGFFPQCMDTVGLFDVLEHIEDDQGFLTQVHQLIKPGGQLFITVPAYQTLWSIDDVSAGHFRRYELQDLCGRLKKAGFKIDFSTYIFALLPLPIFLLRTLPSRWGWRKEVQLDNISTRNEYVSDSNLVNHIFGMELFWLKRLIPLPWGGSCLVAARRVE